VLEVAGLSKSFNGQLVLDGINLEVCRGETVCVLGPSGSGKSTLLRCLNWLETPDAGLIHLAGERVGMLQGGHVRMNDAALSRMRTRMGFVFQHFALWPHLTVLGNVTAAPLHVQRRPRREVEAEARELLRKVGLADRADAFPARLSGGQKQRVGIARALAMRPELVLFDEPTSALDPELVGEVLLVMRELAAEGMTMIVVTHEMGFARDAANRIVFIDRGRVVETGAPEAFLARPQTERARQFLLRYAATAPRERHQHTIEGASHA
jgi:polar amino acid transport system ATP-binding protein